MPKGEQKKMYTGEYKQMVVDKNRQEGLSYREAERQFGISRGITTKWERIYYEKHRTDEDKYKEVKEKNLRYIC
ncbi:MAG: hypothetical protein J1E34_00325 [Oscillospiraceae bacterium]|nr:hypothetical protein [Oscillospiraceae bacterium]